MAAAMRKADFYKDVSGQGAGCRAVEKCSSAEILLRSDVHTCPADSGRVAVGRGSGHEHPLLLKLSPSIPDRHDPPRMVVRARSKRVSHKVDCPAAPCALQAMEPAVARQDHAFRRVPRVSVLRRQ